jgi:predicted ferric reductase
MVCLAGLDLLGAVLAKEWAENGSVRALVLGAGAFLVLFWVYASSLRYAELALVTMGWVVMLQVGLVLIDRWRYGVELPTGKWVAIGVVLVAQAYLVLAPAAEQAGAAAASGS